MMNVNSSQAHIPALSELPASRPHSNDEMTDADNKRMRASSPTSAPAPGERAVRQRLLQSATQSTQAVTPIAQVAQQGALEILESLSQKLKNHPGAEDGVVQVNYHGCDLGAVCWNWVLHGAEDGIHSDPRPDTGARILRPNSTSAKTRDLENMLKSHGFELNEQSNLKVVAYYEAALRKGGSSNPVWNHVEFEYDDQITITKGSGEALKANTGETDMPGMAPIKIGIEASSLKDAHLKAFRGFLAEEPRVL
ncbi:hypothetical protein [Undibacterium sp. TS12]|uniref:hypothetical protein n=1 Tax=Undibacterium sp. TS12 TaxID=2908202 RepID=UPI001F4CEA1B|nr:hypothetical protein [Undibacterium sp. TS12]MCH8621990.1 hypothetical protein [Undibacterium sp. TS12]